MLRYLSTRNEEDKITSTQAVIKGLAPDGGLYVPDDLEPLKLDYIDVINQDYFGMAKIIFAKFFPDFDEITIEDIVVKSYTDKFSASEITPVAKVGDDFVLELYHGPTCAFKDVALSALPNLMIAALRANDFNDEILILTATSGDTGSAALHGFSNVEGTKIMVVFPEGGISKTQQLQMTTQAAPNTKVCAIRGNFDDAQTAVKKIFQEIPNPVEGVSLSSANSINIGRLVPQVVYYFAAYKSLLESGEIAEGDEINFIVPTGNFGDIMAGYFAKAMGLPVGKLVCASNKNDVLTEFLQTGHYDRKRQFYKTTSPSMDILVSSNLERLLYFVCGGDNTKKYMSDLSTAGEYQVTAEELCEIQSDFIGVACGDDEVSAVINSVFKEYGYLMDTHTAVAWAACQKLKDEFEETAGRADDGFAGKKNVVLSTASAYKFTNAVLKSLGEQPVSDDEANIVRLEEITGFAAPKQLKAVFEKPVIHKDVIDVSDMKDYVINCAKE